MHLTSPRIPPLTDDALTPAQREALAPLTAPGPPVLNIFRTLAHAPEALTAFLAWGSYILSKKNALPPRERELVILRIGLMCGSGYEWTQHVEIGRRAGLTADEISGIKRRPWGNTVDPRELYKPHIWNEADDALLTAYDELHQFQFITDKTWTALKAHFTDKQCMDLVFTAGQYTQVSMMLNTFGVQLDEGQTLDPDLDLR